MATATEYGAIAAVISVAIVTTIAVANYFRPVDPVKARYDRIDAECAKPTSDGSHRQVVWIDGKGSQHGYYLCPTR